MKSQIKVPIILLKSQKGVLKVLYRKIELTIEEHLKSGSKKILVVDGARQVGKTTTIRQVGKKLFKNYVEINMLEDSLFQQSFEKVRSVEDFYLQLSIEAAGNLGNKEDTLVFIDEIQAYPHLLTMLKFLAQDNRFTYIASGSLLGVALSQTTSIPMGSIRKIQMYPLDFMEFLYANGIGRDVIEHMESKWKQRESLSEPLHNRLMDLFKKYLIVGGLPEVVASYVEEKDIVKVRSLQKEIREYYATDASKYDNENKLRIRRIYDMIPSYMENKKKRIRMTDINHKKGQTYRDFENDFEYLIHAGITLPVRAISNPKFPLIESTSKNLMKLYLNDVGLLSGILFNQNIRAIMDENRSINLGALYETVVASELASHGSRLFYYDNRSKGEVDFIIDNYQSLSALPIEVKSGRDYSIHSALNNLLKTSDYHIVEGIVLSNHREVKKKNNIVYLPIYYVLFITP